MEMVGRSEPLCSQIGPICLHNGSDRPTISINLPTALSTAKSALSAYTMAQIGLPFPRCSQTGMRKRWILVSLSPNLTTFASASVCLLSSRHRYRSREKTKKRKTKKKTKNKKKKKKKTPKKKKKKKKKKK